MENFEKNINPAEAVNQADEAERLNNLLNEKEALINKADTRIDSINSTIIAGEDIKKWMQELVDFKNENAHDLDESEHAEIDEKISAFEAALSNKSEKTA